MGWLAKLAGFALPSWGLYAMLAGAFVAWGGYTAYLMHEFDEGRYAAAATDRAVLAAVQKSQTDAQILAWKRLKEAVDEKAKLQDDLRKSQLAAADKRVLDALSKARGNGRLLSGPPGSPTGDIRICASRDTIDRLVGTAINDAVGRHAKRNFQLAEEGARAVSVATLCRDWTKALQ